MKISPQNLLLLVLSAAVILSVYWMFPKRDANTQIGDLAPIALEAFDHCINSAIQGVPLSEETLGAEIVALSETVPGPKGSSFYFEIKEDFKCLVVVPPQYYDPIEMRERFAQLKASKFDGRMSNCGWGSNWGGEPATVLGCNMNSESNPSYSFKLSLVFFAPDSAIFWLRPFLIFDTDGYVKIVE